MGEFERTEDIEEKVKPEIKAEADTKSPFKGKMHDFDELETTVVLGMVSDKTEAFIEGLKDTGQQYFGSAPRKDPNDIQASRGPVVCKKG